MDLAILLQRQEEEKKKIKLWWWYSHENVDGMTRYASWILPHYVQHSITPKWSQARFCLLFVCTLLEHFPE